MEPPFRLRITDRERVNLGDAAAVESVLLRLRRELLRRLEACPVGYGAELEVELTAARTNEA